jgi:hypothetical protein
VQIVLGISIAALLDYHIIGVAVPTANLSNGQTLPTNLTGGNITIIRNPQNPGNITFAGAANKPDTAANNTNIAAILVKDIPVVGHPAILMDVVDKVLVPPETVFNATDRASSKADIEKAADQANAPAAGTDAAVGPSGEPAPKVNHAGYAGASILSVMFGAAMAVLFAY